MKVNTTDPKRKIVIKKEKDGLIAKISGQETYPLIFQSDTKFQFKKYFGCEL